MGRGTVFLLALLCVIFYVNKAESVASNTLLHHASKKCKEWAYSLGGCARIPPSEPQCPKHLDLLVEFRQPSENNAQRLVRLRSQRLLFFIKYAREHLNKNRNSLITEEGVNVAGYFDKVINWLRKRIKRNSNVKVRAANRHELNRNRDVKFESLVKYTCRSTFKEGQKLSVPSQKENFNTLSAGLRVQVFNGRRGNIVKKMQSYCENVILDGREALKTYLAPRFQNESLDIDLFEGSEFMFGADLCVAKQNRFHARFKCCYQWTVQKPFLKHEFHLHSQSRMRAFEKMGDSYGPHSWCGEIYHSLDHIKFFSVAHLYDIQAVVSGAPYKNRRSTYRNGAYSLGWKSKEVDPPRVYRSNPTGCKRWMKKYKELDWVPLFNVATTCPCEVKINFKQHHKNYAGPKKEILDEWCKRHSFCKEVDAIYISDQFHPGSDFCIRTNPAKNMKYVSRNRFVGGGKPQKGSNQCCYGHESESSWKRGTFTLILSGTAAGTPDLGVGKYEHAVADVVPVHQCGVEEYLHLRPPFIGGKKGAGCKRGLSSPMMLSEAEVVEDPLHAFAVPRKLTPIFPETQKKDSTNVEASWKAYMANLKHRERYPDPGDILLGKIKKQSEQKWW